MQGRRVIIVTEHGTGHRDNRKVMNAPARLKRTFAAFCVVLLGALSAAQAWAAPAGRFIAVVGDVEVIDQAGGRRTVRTGEALESGDTVVTSPGGFAQLRLADGGRISVRSDTRFTLDDFSFKGEADRLGRMFISLVKGSLRSLTGLIGRRNQAGYRIKTPHATIGVRGTDHETFVITTPQPGGYQPGTFDWCFQGRTIMQSQAGAVVVAPQQVAYVGAPNVRPTILPDIPEFLRSRVAAQPQVRRGEQKSPGPAVQPAKGGDGKSQAVKRVPGLKTVTPTKTLQQPSLELQKEPVLINPLITPTSPTAITDPSISPSKLEPIAPSTTTLSPTLETAPSTTTLSPTLETAPSTKTVSPTLKTVPPPTKISPTLKTEPSTTTLSPTLKSVPPTKTVPPK